MCTDIVVLPLQTAELEPAPDRADARGRHFTPDGPNLTPQES
ncbi:hypothetical protein ACIP2X_10000 [Streptomyces sp. NPDC089424]